MLSFPKSLDFSHIYAIIVSEQRKGVSNMELEMTYHCKVERKDRVQRIIDTIGLGQIVKKKYMRSTQDALAGKPGHFICITDTGITLVKDEKTDIIITMYVTTYKQLLEVYGSQKSIPTLLRKRVDRNQSFYIKDGKTIWK